MTVMMLYGASVSFLERRDAEEQPERHLKTEAGVELGEYIDVS